MSPRDRLQRRKSARAARGFTFVEIMVALALGLFLIGGLLTLVQAMRRTATNQSGMSQLQDNERMAMQLITDVVQSTGYYTSPLTNSAASAFLVGTYGPATFRLGPGARGHSRRWRPRHHHEPLPDRRDDVSATTPSTAPETRPPRRRAS